MRQIRITFSLAILLMLTSLFQVSANAQTFTVLHSFSGGGDGANPTAGVTVGPGGSLYGTASGAGSGGFGTVFKLTNNGSGWVLAPLYSFQDGTDGANPNAPVVFGPDGSLYGTTTYGGVGCSVTGCGTVFKLRPAPNARGNALGQWTETVLYSFTGANGDGAYPYLGSLVFDASGNLYGTTYNGGQNDQGTVYELSPANGGWTENILYTFTGGSDGRWPAAGVILDGDGNLYGTATQGGSSTYDAGTVYQLSHSGSSWTDNTIYAFHGDGDYPYGGVMFDQVGNLYGTTAEGGIYTTGTAFELAPSGGSWNYSLMHDFIGSSGNYGPVAGLVMDAAGNLYGTTYQDGAYNLGSVFELTPTQTGWTYTDLHDFQGGTNDGALPYGGVALDANGNLYGTTDSGGSANAGTVWEITLAAGMRHPGKLQPHGPVHYVPTLSK